MILVRATELDRVECAGLARAAPPAGHGHPDEFAGRVVRKPWGAERQLYRNAELSAWLLDIRSGGETSMHCHPGKTTVLIVQRGAAVLTTLCEVFYLEAGDSVLIEPGAFHRTASALGAKVVEVETPPDKHDLLRLSDAAGRGQGYEAEGRPPEKPAGRATAVAA